MPLMTMGTAVIIVYTLYRMYTFPMSHDYPWIAKYSLYRRAPLHTSDVCARKSLQGLFNSFVHLVTYPLRLHRQCEHHTNPEAPSRALWAPAITAVPTLSHGSAIVASPNIPAVLSNLNLLPKGMLFHIFHYIRLQSLVNFGATSQWFS
jgi:hypothetical protein